MSKELYEQLERAASRTGKNKNALIIDALTQYLESLDRVELAAEARRQSELVSRRESDTTWYDLADASAWK